MEINEFIAKIADLFEDTDKSEIQANTKFKERFVQEGSRLFYQTLLIDLFNSTL